MFQEQTNLKRLYVTTFIIYTLKFVHTYNYKNKKKVKPVLCYQSRIGQPILCGYFFKVLNVQPPVGDRKGRICGRTQPIVVISEQQPLGGAGFNCVCQSVLAGVAVSLHIALLFRNLITLIGFQRPVEQ